jgi:MFS family permease
LLTTPPFSLQIMSGAILTIKTTLNLSKVQQEVVLGSLQLTSAVGGLLSSYISDACGRRKAMGLCMLLYCIGSGMMVSGAICGDNATTSALPHRHTAAPH